MRNPRNDTLGSARTGSDDSRHGGGERRCVLTGEHAGRDDMLRLALSPDGLVLPDALARAPGRGAWVSISRDELAEAIASGKLNGALSRAFKTGAIEIPADLPELAEKALRRAFLDRLGLEMRSGRLILGSDRIANEARTGKVAALYHASDASADGRRKLDQAWRVGLDEEGSGRTGETLPLDRAALSVALGRDNVVHMALADNASAGRVAVVLGRLQSFLGAAHAVRDRGDVPAGNAAHDIATI